MKLSFRHLAAVTTGLAFSLILLGVYTGAMGAGLACAGRWPLCDGWLGLFPANWPSFIEWFHRFVAMIAGFFILGVGISAWRKGRNRWIRYASAVAVVVLPVQVLLGANTIFNFGVVAQVLHHAAALLILTALTVTTTLAFVDSDSPAASTGDTATAGTGSDERARSTDD
ncbi:COX15/CtaA family protein [Salinibaculum rarum]|uniref:COX15/CtaA family protein n=1 Tax=Salinibaculum rarum TaxID=3058903 RepID=UPI0026600D01|nr:COX15/CtaA family protein [Salinibaculum sp. KK48]